MSTVAMQQLNPELLWQFSLACYPQVKALCLRWQDQYGANVNVMLALCYAERLSWQVSHESLESAILQLNPINRQLTAVLRDCRRKLGNLFLDSEQELQLKQHLLGSELLAEQVEQQRLSRDLTFMPVATPDNLAIYLQQLNLPLSDTLTKDLIDLRQASAEIPHKAS
jgi:uncharacterized protein (TIGR02444 family)